MSCGRHEGGGGRKDGRTDGRPLGFARGKKPAWASVKGMGGPPLRVRAVISKHALFSRLEWSPGVCFVRVTPVSNRSGSRLEIIRFERRAGRAIYRRAESIARQSQRRLTARTRFEKHALFSRLERSSVFCILRVTWVSNRIRSRLEIVRLGRRAGGRKDDRKRECLARGALLQRRI